MNYDEDEFEKKLLIVKEKVVKFVWRILDFFVEKFVKFIVFCKSFYKWIMCINFLLMCIIIVVFVVIIYLVIVLVYNVMNVIVIEELGGYEMILFCFDIDYCFINFVIDD